MYRHGGLDIFLAPAFQDRGLGREALRLGAQLADRGARAPPADHRPGGEQRAGDRHLRGDRLQAGRGHAPLRARARRRRGTTGC